MAAVALCYMRTSRNPVPVALVTSDDDYFYGTEGPMLDAGALKKAGEIEEVTLRFVTPQIGLESYYLRMRKDGHMFRRLASLSDYRMAARDALKTVETAESSFSEFKRISYLIAKLPYRSLPPPGVYGADLDDWQLEVVSTGRAKQRYCFYSEPPEYWALLQSMRKVDADAKWKILERKTEPMQLREPTSSTSSRQATTSVTPPVAQEARQP